MADVDVLRAHLAEHYGFHAKTVFVFEDDVVLVRDDRDRRWVARVFAPDRARSAVEGDGAILSWLAAHDFPAERPACADPVSQLSGRTVLVTEAVPAVARARRRQTIKDAGGIGGLGALLARLATLELDDPVVQRPGGAWHHMADGLPDAELAVAGEWLKQAQAGAGVRELSAFGVLSDALEAIDGCAELPQALIHPDFVLANVVASEAAGDGRPGMVIVDWAGAGRGPRLWSLAFLLWAEGAKDLRRVDLAAAGYRRLISLEPAELERLEAVIGARPLVFDIWRLHHGSLSVGGALSAWRRRRPEVAAIAERARTAFSR